jgi:hypothetical protein
MKFRFADLWRWDSTMDRGAYALIGLIGFALKHNLDRLLATGIFHRPWGIFNYWIPLSQAAQISKLNHADAVFLGGMLALSLPFVWIGVTLTLRRLRSAGLPLWLVILFFAPFVNLAFFLLLAVLPARDTVPGRLQPGEAPRPRLLGGLIPANPAGSAAMSLVLTVPFAWGFALLGTQVLFQYGWGLFVALPFTLGLTSVLLYGYREPRSFGNCFIVATLSTLFLGLGLLAMAFEGMICLVMAAPIGLSMSIMGGSLGYFIQKRHWFQQTTSAMLFVMLLFVPGSAAYEYRSASESPSFEVRTSLEIDAPRDLVWQKVVAFTEIPAPKEWMFRAGIAYPMRAEIYGRGPGAVRHCVFSTGPFVEPIQVWDEPKLLRFSVAVNPAPMQEWTPYPHVDPPHLHGFFISRQGQFLLQELPGGRTRLEGTTWYQHGLWPATYWRFWSDAIVHQIHTRVLRHIQQLAEHDEQTMRTVSE